MNRTLARWTITLGLSLVWWIGTTWGAEFTGRNTSLPRGVDRIDVSLEPAKAPRGGLVTWKLVLDLSPFHHTYPTRQTDEKAQSQVNSITFRPSSNVLVVGKLEEPAPLTKPEPELGINQLGYYEGQVVWKRTLLVRPTAAVGEQTIETSVRLLICDDQHCFPPKTVVLRTPLTVTSEPIPVDPRYAGELEKGNPAISGTLPAPAPNEGNPSSSALEEVAVTSSAGNYQEVLQSILAQLQPLEASHGGLMAFVLAGIFWGAVSLVTPCVFPMIPITVSYFLKQSEKEHHRPITMALVYCTTIVVVLTIAAVTLLSFFRWLSVSPLMNIGLGLLFFFFALSLFGMYDLELPSGLARFTSSREGRGGLVGTMFMALTFTILSFACVAPFLGGFGGTAATANLSLVDRILGGLAFAATFSAPFFILALFPTLLKKLPKSGTWLNSVKVVMGFLELAAAFKFFRAGELVLLAQPTLFTFDFVLGIWVALSLLCGLYLLGFFRLPYDSPLENLGVPRMLFSALFLALGFYLLPALFQVNADGQKQRPSGVIYAWVDSFLLPESRPHRAGLTWTTDLQQAVTEAREQRRRTGEPQLIFLDFTGEICTNCRFNEENVFSQPEIKSLFQQYQLVQLYTDKVPTERYLAGARAQLGKNPNRPLEDAAANLWFQREAFGTEQLPLYVILEPQMGNQITVRGIYAEGKINNAEGFADFLKAPLETGGTLTQAASR